MNTEKQIKAIAVIDGWTPVSETLGFPPKYMIDRFLASLPPEEAASIGAVDYCSFPNYLTSRDAIVPVIEKWCGDDEERWAQFFNAVGDVINHLAKSRFQSAIAQFKMTAAQLAEALLRATGKWVEE